MMEIASLLAITSATANVPRLQALISKIPHWPIPKNGFRVAAHLAEKLNGFRSDIDTLPAVFNVALKNLAIANRARTEIERIHRKIINWQQKFHSLGGGLFECGLGDIHLIGSHKLLPTERPCANAKV